MDVEKVFFTKYGYCALKCLNTQAGVSWGNLSYIVPW